MSLKMPPSVLLRVVCRCVIIDTYLKLTMRRIIVIFVKVCVTDKEIYISFYILKIYYFL